MSKPINNQAIADLNAEVNEVTRLLKTNVEKIVDRGERIDNLHERSANLDNNAIRFQKSAVDVKKKARCRSIKMNLFIILAVCMFFGVLAGILVGVLHKDHEVKPTTVAPTTHSSLLLHALRI